MAASHGTDRISARRDLGDNPGLVFITPCPTPPGAGEHFQPADWLPGSNMFSVHSKPNGQTRPQTRRSQQHPEGGNRTPLTVYGVEPICKVLPIAPSTYHDHVAKRVDPSKLSVRAHRDLVLKPEIEGVFAENFEVYGARKVWRQLNREGVAVARCTVERLMADLGLQGVIRGKPVRTTMQDKAAACPQDHVNRQFHAPAPNMLWLSDFTSL